MRYLVIAVGRLRPPFADDADHYLGRLRAHAKVEMIEVKTDDAVEKRIPDGAYVVMLDERGKSRDSMAFSRFLDERRLDGRPLVFVVGGAFGLKLARANETIAFGPATMPHQLARVVLLEQLYRGLSILAGSPYHHDDNHGN
ncbi:MAG: 23S rRNA (pseudouridine(1915)-N(3))-methyltransferase RlmH [Solirubrobacteraceae bacterium]|nr:23S rRNA (pseudouridine(1915)-N(3))-methyltransferase RlmH [Solirubrobacteraceae bacterium]